LIHLPADLWDHWDPEPLVLQRAEDIISIVNLVMDELLLEKKDIFLKVAEGLGQDLGQIIQKSRIFHCHIWLSEGIYLVLRMIFNASEPPAPN
jgi:hypothetical protein